jgi:structural maintenance of chromosomes protein 6
LTNITQTQKLLVAKKEATPDLRARLNGATARYQEATRAREQKKRADDLKKELAWAHVASKGDEYSKKMEEVARLARRLSKIEDSVKGAQVILRMYRALADTFIPLSGNLRRCNSTGCSV